MYTDSARRVAARHHMAGLIKPPPAMVEAVYKWAAACLALTEKERDEKRRQERIREYDHHAEIRALENLVAQVRKSPTKWKVYSEYAKATLVFGYGPWGSLPYKAFTKLTPEDEARLRGRVEEDLRAVEGRIDAWRAQERENTARQVAHAAELQRVVSEGSEYSPGTVPQTREFPLDLTGWQYNAGRFQALLEKQHAAQVQQFETAIGMVREKSPDEVPQYEHLLASVKKNPRWRTVKVVLSENIASGGTGGWSEVMQTLSLKAVPFDRDTLENLHETVYHELQHMTQSFMSYALWSASAAFDKVRATQPGFPKPEARTPQYVQHGTPTREVGRDALHSLDDIEFHTDLQGAITRYKRVLARSPDMTPEQRRVTFDHYTSRKIAPREWGKWNPPVESSKFFAVLKRHAPKKYVEAVRELAAAVL